MKIMNSNIFTADEFKSFVSAYDQKNLDQDKQLTLIKRTLLATAGVLLVNVAVTAALVLGYL
jgi:hypothetical protein